MKAFLKRFDKNEKNLADRFRAQFIRQERELLKKMKSKKSAISRIDNWLFDIEDEVKAMIVATHFIYNNIYEKEGNHALALLGLPENFDIYSPKLTNLIKKQMTENITRINETTRDRLRKELLEGIKEGEGIGILAHRVKKEMEYAKTSRVLTIARTETLRAANTAGFSAYADAGVGEKEWNTSMDGRERPTHHDVDGKVKKMNEKFHVGNSYLNFPGDPAGSAKETINCRCSLLPIVE